MKQKDAAAGPGALSDSPYRADFYGATSDSDPYATDTAYASPYTSGGAEALDPESQGDDAANQGGQAKACSKGRIGQHSVLTESAPQRTGDFSAEGSTRTQKTGAVPSSPYGADYAALFAPALSGDAHQVGGAGNYSGTSMYGSYGSAGDAKASQPGFGSGTSSHSLPGGSTSGSTGSRPHHGSQSGFGASATGSGMPSGGSNAPRTASSAGLTGAVAPSNCVRDTFGLLVCR
jgi:hypothetical protein